MTRSVAFLDVNETLSDLAPLRERFEQVGAPGELMPTWFAATLRDGIALTASGEYAAFQDVARGNLHALLAGSPQLRLPIDEATGQVLTAMGRCPCTRTSRRASACCAKRGCAW